MVTAILAHNHLEAQETAGKLRIKPIDWIYPMNLHLLRGITIDRIIYVEGWMTSQISAEVLQHLLLRMTPEADEIAVGIGDEELVQQDARHELERRQILANLTAPSIDPSQLVAAPRYARGITKLPLWRRIIRAIAQFGRDVLGGLQAWLNYSR